MLLEDLGLIGNCQFSALVSRTGSIVWSCLPRFDSEPVFARLLDPDGGELVVGAAGGEPGAQAYIANTNVLQTTFQTKEGRFRVVDFAPRYQVAGRYERPTRIVRILEPLEGAPRVEVRCAPRLGWSKRVPGRSAASGRVTYYGFEAPLYLDTDVPLSYLDGESFTLTEPRFLVLSWGAPLDEPLAPYACRTREATIDYWQRWVKHCNVPPLYQQEVIRSALALKLHCFEDTGAIVAAMTTSLPEAPGGAGRTWDYRYCWLRDAYYVLSALRLLGHFEERERFTQFLLDIAGRTPELDLAPLYRVDGSSDLTEVTQAEWAGYAGERPVRVGNAAALHQQHDVFGEMVLALTPIYLDDRFSEERSRQTLDLIERLARKAVTVAGRPDAGIWEYRTAWQPQTFSSLMCWAAADRMALVAGRHRPAIVDEMRGAAERLRREIVDRAWSPRLGSFVSRYGGEDLDAALLQMPILRFPGADDLVARTVDAIGHGLGEGGWLYRYRTDDGFGRPEVAFVICTFWFVEALARVGRHDEAKSIFERTLRALSPLGLLSEDLHVKSGRLWGNFPQAYSHVGLIHAAFAVAPRWSEIL
jgi:GH15 family glucan-1,4-alpha-glucosidase